MLGDLRLHLTKLGHTPETAQRVLNGEPVPRKAIEQACTFLREHKHRCGGIWASGSERLKWCGRTDADDVCREVEERKQMERANEKEMKRAHRLEKQGHTCVEILESFPVQIRWCRQPVCTEQRGFIQTVRDAFKTTPMKPAKSTKQKYM